MTEQERIFEVSLTVMECIDGARYRKSNKPYAVLHLPNTGGASWQQRYTLLS